MQFLKDIESGVITLTIKQDLEEHCPKHGNRIYTASNGWEIAVYIDDDYFDYIDYILDEKGHHIEQLDDWVMYRPNQLVEKDIWKINLDRPFESETLQKMPSRNLIGMQCTKCGNRVIADEKDTIGSFEQKHTALAIACYETCDGRYGPQRRV